MYWLIIEYKKYRRKGGKGKERRQEKGRNREEESREETGRKEEKKGERIQHQPRLSSLSGKSKLGREHWRV